MPQKSVDPTPTWSSTISRSPARSNSASSPARRAIGRYRSRYASSSSTAASGAFAPRLQPGQSMAKAATFFSFGPALDDGSNDHAGNDTKGT